MRDNIQDVTNNIKVEKLMLDNDANSPREVEHNGCDNENGECRGGTDTFAPDDDHKSCVIRY